MGVRVAEVTLATLMTIECDGDANMLAIAEETLVLIKPYLRASTGWWRPPVRTH